MDETLKNVRVSEGVFEALADRVDWGQPDVDGFYTPTLFRDFGLRSSLKEAVSNHWGCDLECTLVNEVRELLKT